MDPYYADDSVTLANRDQVAHVLSELLDDEPPMNERRYLAPADAVIALIEAQVREQVAREIDESRWGMSGSYVPGHYAGLAHAARIARGVQR